MPSEEAWVQRPSGLIKSEEKRKIFNLKVRREVGVEVNVDNQSKSLLYTRSHPQNFPFLMLSLSPTGNFKS